MTVEIIAKEKIDCTNLLGTFLDESHYKILVEQDTDCYMPLMWEEQPSEKKVAFKFRKNFFTKEEQEQAYIGLREAATQSQNRGLAAGPRGDILGTDGRGGREWVGDYELEILDFLTRPINVLVDDDSVEKIRSRHKDRSLCTDVRGKVWLRSEVCKKYPEYFGWFDKWVDGLHNLPRQEQVKEANYVIDHYISNTNYAQSVYSGIAGYFDRYPRIPYGRATSYTRDNYDKFKLSFPFLQSLNRGFKELLPERWQAQKNAIDKIDPRFTIPDTVFTTITVNKSFRTAAHLDAGDFSDGMSNLLVVSNGGKYTGGYLVFPEYKIAVNVRPGDLLLVNNHEIMHGNTPIVLEEETAERISLVVYLRENMQELGTWEYEQCRLDFIEANKANKNHRFQKRLWNGIYPSMWSSQEWYDFLEQKLGKDVLLAHHPECKKQNTLEAFLT